MIDNFISSRNRIINIHPSLIPSFCGQDFYGLRVHEAALANVEELLKSNAAWSSLSAVQNGNYYEIDKALYNSKPNARWGEAYKILVDILYPGF